MPLISTKSINPTSDLEPGPLFPSLLLAAFLFSSHALGSDITINNITTYNGNVSSNDGAVFLTNSGTFNGNVDLGTDVASFVQLNGGTLTGNITMGNNAQLVTVAGGNLVGKVDGSSANVGTLNFNNSRNLTNGTTIGATNAITTLNIASGVALNVKNNVVNANSVNVGNGSSLTLGTAALTTSTISLDSGSTLIVKNGTIAGAIDGTAAGNGTINFNNSFTLAAGTSIGATNAISALNIAVVTSFNAGNNTIKANNISIASTSSLTLGTGAIVGSINGTAANVGTLNFNGNNILAAGTSIGI